jgi:Protein of unknown function (DUF664)
MTAENAPNPVPLEKAPLSITRDDLADLFFRDLSRLMQEIEAFPSDAMLWQIVPGITNPGGNLVLHIEGNLREYIGRQLGQLPYSRNRALEFTAKGVEREELMGRILELRRLVPSLIQSLSQEALETNFPEAVLGKALSTRAFLIHLYGHLNWHLGQLDYLRRTLSGQGAIAWAGL